MKKIQLQYKDRTDLFALVDDEDYEKLSKYTWRACFNHRHIKAQRCYKDADGSHTIFMHTQLIMPPEGMVVDHIDCNGLNNQKSNLRVATVAENARNQRKRLGKHSSKYKGVCRWRKKEKYPWKWKATIIVDRQHIHLGYFKTEIEAAKAYNEASLKYHGEYGRLNEVA